MPKVSKLKLVNFNVRDFENLKDKKWMLGNRVLYDLCKKHPLHENDEEIRAKVWLIGRSYAASIERRKKKNKINDDFYDYVTQEFIKFNKKKGFDDQLKEISKSRFNEDSLKEILKLHYELTTFFNKITGLDKRSLASKYLHFHVPIFPIYDSRAKDSLNQLVKGRVQIKGDKQYCIFCNKILFLFNRIKEETGRDPTLRQIDTYLIKIANERLNGNK
jgi:hypothetical protein